MIQLVSHIAPLGDPVTIQVRGLSLCLRQQEAAMCIVGACMITAALVGDPNSGKTTLFNLLTHKHQRVGNWPGVTVEKHEGMSVN